LSYGDKLVLVRRLREMDLAAELRWSLLPPLTFSSPRVGISGILEPAYEIAGDCFDYAVNGDLVHLAIVDAMGHGLEASRMATLAITSYRHSRRRGLGLLDTFTAMDELVASQFGMEKFVTGQLGLLDLPTGRLAWLNAGHPKPMLLRDGKVSDLGECETALPIGLGDVPRGAAEVSLRPGDAVLFLTDGVIEARSPDGHQFGRTRLSRLWVEAAAAGDVPAEVMRRLCHAVLDHQRGQLQDDATLMVVVWKGPGTPPEG
jgi:serine phosphatase RsbU (regulator of sigma subunit)